MKPIIFCNGTYINRFEDFIEVVRFAASTKNKVVSKRLQQEINALFRDGIMLDWLKYNNELGTVYSALSRVTYSNLSDTELFNYIVSTLAIEHTKKAEITLSDYVDFPSAYTLIEDNVKETELCDLGVSIDSTQNYTSIRFVFEVKEVANESVPVCLKFKSSRGFLVQIGVDSISLISKGKKTVSFDISKFLREGATFILVAKDCEVARVDVDSTYVDLGLSVKWASCNDGAKKSNQPGQRRLRDGAVSLQACIPTVEEWRELFEKCDSEKLVVDGIPVTKYSGNGKSVIVPDYNYWAVLDHKGNDSNLVDKLGRDTTEFDLLRVRLVQRL